MRRSILLIFLAITMLASLAWAEGLSFNDPLVDAADRGDKDQVVSLLKSGHSVDSEGDFGVTALMRAAFRGNSDIVKILLNVGAYVNADDLGGATALHLAARNGNADIVQMLLEANANVDTPDKEQWTPLMRAVVAKQAKVVHLLLDHGADVSRANEFGETVLVHAASAGVPEIISMILDAKSAGGLPEEQRQQALAIVQKRGNHEAEAALTSAPGSAAPAAADSGTFSLTVNNPLKQESPAAPAKEEEPKAVQSWDPRSHMKRRGGGKDFELSMKNSDGSRIADDGQSSPSESSAAQVTPTSKITAEALSSSSRNASMGGISADAEGAKTEPDEEIMPWKQASDYSYKVPPLPGTETEREEDAQPTSLAPTHAARDRSAVASNASTPSHITVIVPVPVAKPVTMASGIKPVPEVPKQDGIINQEQPAATVPEIHENSTSQATSEGARDVEGLPWQDAMQYEQILPLSDREAFYHPEKDETPNAPERISMRKGDAKKGEVKKADKKATKAVVESATFFLIQLGAYPEETAALDSWARMQRNNPDVLSNLQPYVIRAFLAQNNAVVYRLRVGYFDRKSDANKICTQLRSRNIDCFIVETSMDPRKATSHIRVAKEENARTSDGLDSYVAKQLQESGLYPATVAQTAPGVEPEVASGVAQNVAAERSVSEGNVGALPPAAQPENYDMPDAVEHVMLEENVDGTTTATAQDSAQKTAAASAKSFTPIDSEAENNAPIDMAMSAPERRVPEQAAAPSIEQQSAPAAAPEAQPQLVPEQPKAAPRISVVKRRVPLPVAKPVTAEAAQAQVPVASNVGEGSEPTTAMSLDAPAYVIAGSSTTGPVAESQGAVGETLPWHALPVSQDEVLPWLGQAPTPGQARAVAPHDIPPLPNQPQDQAAAMATLPQQAPAYPMPWQMNIQNAPSVPVEQMPVPPAEPYAAMEQPVVEPAPQSTWSAPAYSGQMPVAENNVQDLPWKSGAAQAAPQVSEVPPMPMATMPEANNVPIAMAPPSMPQEDAEEQARKEQQLREYNETIRRRTREEFFKSQGLKVPDHVTDENYDDYYQQMEKKLSKQSTQYQKGAVSEAVLVPDDTAYMGKAQGRAMQSSNNADIASAPSGEAQVMIQGFTDSHVASDYWSRMFAYDESMSQAQMRLVQGENGIAIEVKNLAAGLPAQMCDIAITSGQICTVLGGAPDTATASRTAGKAAAVKNAPAKSSEQAEPAQEPLRGNYWATLGTFNTVSEAEYYWMFLMEDHGDLLRRYKYDTPPASNGEFSDGAVKLNAGPFTTLKQAQQLCTLFSTRRVACVAGKK